MARLSLLVPCALALTLAGCNSGGGGDNAQALNALDANLTGNAVDPALAGALEDQIMVDPSLAAQANGDSIRPASQPAQAAFPADALPGAPASAEVMAAAGGKLMRVPAPTKSTDPCTDCDETPVTLGTLAQRQAKKRGKSCTARLNYAMGWAQKLPADTPLYPKARIAEAAGADGDCTTRVVSFTTGATLQEVLDFYYTRAIRSGFAASHEVDGAEHRVGGARLRDDGVFVAMARALPGGGTEVDLISDTGG